MKANIAKSLLLGALSTVLLTGCFFDDDDKAPATSTPTPITYSTGRFVDVPVMGLSYQSDSISGSTDADGQFQYQAGDNVSFTAGPVILGSTSAKSLVTPFDLSSDEAIIKAIASLLQSLDDDPADNIIRLSDQKLAALATALGGTVDISALVDDPATANDEVQDALDALDAALQVVSGADYVAPNDALLVLVSSLAQSDYMVRNVSRTPEARTDKAGADILGTAVPARTSSGDLLADYGDVNPIVMVYEDGIGPNGEFDTFAATSYDNGATWKRVNLSRQAGKSINIGTFDDNGSIDHPSMHIEGDYLIVSWVSTYCKGSADYVDAGAIPATVVNPAKTVLEDEGLFDPVIDTTVDDLFQVLGSQGTVDYTAIYPNVGIVPYHCTWVARGVLDVDGSLGTTIGLTDDTTGQIIWYNAEQLTSGVRDAKLAWPAGLEDFGFGLAWQEDPEGLLPGEGEGPGVGWSGAKTHHKTDIWYSFLNWADFEAAAELDADTGRPKPAVPMSVPVPVSDNISCNVDAQNQKLVCTTTTYCADTATVPVQRAEDVGTFCVVDYDATAGYTEDVDAVLDGDTSASRPNLHFAPVLDGTNNVIGARALLMYEESKGLCELGNGCKDSDLFPYDIGKYVMYHHMPDFTQPQMVAKGDILSAPVQTATTDPFDDSASYAPEVDNDLYENARRERFVVNSDPTNDTKFVMIYKQGWYNQGERADIFMRRAVGGYDIGNFTPDVCVSCVTPAFVELVEDETAYTVKVQSWTWAPENLDDESWANPYDDARSLRAQLNGDRLLVGFAWTPNWQLATNADPNDNFKDNYDFFVRRSFDGGASFTNIAGDVEGPRNTSYLENNKESVVEPRIATFGDSILVCDKDVDGNYTGTGCLGASATVVNEDFFVVTYCTAANIDRLAVGGIPVHAPGLDCYYSWTTDNGESYIAPTKEVTVKDESGNDVLLEVPDFDCLTCGDEEQVEPEIILTEGSSFEGTPFADDHAGVIAEMHGAWVQNNISDDGSSLGTLTGSDAWYGLFELKPEVVVTP